eukprot:gnl/TRDRNA2_/TRDRNA2_179410_c0_seq1.p1 gnl/TRDRNA2_/TRDRNA2_179410_c0~~gnl/TRDRNA2_/TRDRNA2_179410_c0_seq1.p1  ORF type:complete len:133 (+),score=17.46 gnl/TRDRNA2_/TRDRNA2_179410_c0_seq1:57-455(+)
MPRRLSQKPTAAGAQKPSVVEPLVWVKLGSPTAKRGNAKAKDAANVFAACEMRDMGMSPTARVTQYEVFSDECGRHPSGLVPKDAKSEKPTWPSLFFGLCRRGSSNNSSDEPMHLHRRGSLGPSRAASRQKH